MPTGRLALLTLVTAVFALALAAAAAARVPKRIVFPVVGKVAYQNDYGDPRPQGGHEGNDIMGRRWQLAVAAEAGRVEKVGRGGYSCYLVLNGRRGTASASARARSSAMSATRVTRTESSRTSTSRSVRTATDRSTRSEA
jgi:hypothetical protein